MPRVFFAFDSKSSNVAESVHDVCSLLVRNGHEAVPWDKASKPGSIVIDEILDQIDHSDLLCADCTTLNPNVLFELGFAIARQKQVVITLDAGLQPALKRFNEFALLSPVQYESSVNEGTLSTALASALEESDKPRTLFERLLSPHFVRGGEELVLHLKPRDETNANKKLSRFLAGQNCPRVLTDDPSEAIQTLPWYASKVFNSVGVFAHLLGEDRQDSLLTNARYSLISGLAHGLNRRLLVLAENSYTTPFDYQLILQRYRDSNQAVDIVRDWYDPIEKEYLSIQSSRAESKARQEKTTELRSLYLGEVVAEQEPEEMLDDCFVETTLYRDALEGRANIFVGRKGSGKTATLFKLKRELSRDSKCFVCLIKPEAYELEGLLRLTGELESVGTSDYGLQSLWKYLILSELAVQLYRSIILQPAYVRSAAESKLVDWITAEDRLLRGDFATRLEDAIARISGLASSDRPLLDWQEEISKKLHGGPIKELNENLQAVLAEKTRVAVLIDNLDKMWDAESDLTRLIEFVFALLSVTSDTGKLFDRKAVHNSNCRVTVTLFLRSDIFHRVRKGAREADKLTYKKIVWSDREILLRVVDERYAFATGNAAPERSIWQAWFVEGDAARDRVMGFIQPRPRDLVYCVKSAIEVAANRGQIMVRKEDLHEALFQYSRFALDSIITESKVLNLDMEAIVTEFIDSKPIVTHNEVARRIEAAGVPVGEVLNVVRELCLTGFLGLRIGDRDVSFLEDVDDYDRARKQALLFTVKKRVPVVYAIRRAFWPFLDIAREDDSW